MAVLFHFAPRAGAAIDPRRDLLLEGEAITIGRAPRSDLRLSDAAIRYEHAVLSAGADGLRLRMLGAAPGTPEILLDAPGAFALIGPFRLTRAAAEPGADAVVVVTPEPVAPGGEAGAAWYQRAFDVSLPNVRLMALILCCVIALLGFAVPLALAPHVATGGALARLAASSWNVGVMSRAHRFFGDNCAACHGAAFARVSQNACLHCHTGIGQHADPVLAPAADLRGQRCETCHREHKGEVLATRAEQADCAACHVNIHATAPGSTLRPAGDFAFLHPDFAPSLVTDAALRKVAPVAAGVADPPDASGLRFTHAHHLGLPQLRKPGDAACAQCHVPDASAASFKPVTYAAACASCHAMAFEPRHPEWHLPHGNAGEIQSRIAGYYARAILAGEAFPPPAPGLFARPGAAPPADPPQGQALADALTEAAMASSIRRSDCGECHVVTKSTPGAGPAAWHVAPVYVPERFLPRAKFSHASHATTPCATCHAARKSDGGPVALLPPIGTCRQCHAGEQAEGARVASSCVTCHGFHQPAHPLMTPISVETK